MPNRIAGLHHVTALASDARATDAFYTETLGLRRVKKTVNFDAPDVYHLYYGDETGRPGSVMTYFPFPGAAPARPGTGAVGETRFAIPEGTAASWVERLGNSDVGRDAWGATHLGFTGPDGERLALVEVADDTRAPWTGGGVAANVAIRGLHGVTLNLMDTAETADLLQVMGFERQEQHGGMLRMAVPGGTAGTVDLAARPDLEPAREGAGAIHHIAFSVPDRAAQDEMRARMAEIGMRVTQPIDRDYFWAIYFRSPGGVLFEIATETPGFDRDEPVADLGRSLKLPRQHEAQRPRLERSLPPLET